ncbi:MAG: ATP-binding protein [Candidatus Neoclostridium sp.]
MKKRIFRQIFLLTFACIAILFAYGLIAVTTNSKMIVKERLIDETKLACSLVRSEEDFGGFSEYYNSKSLRVTVIDLEGNVLFESDTNAVPESHIDREEIRNAIKNTPQAVERYSETLGCKMTYYAMKTELDDGSKVIIRMAVKSSDINGYVGITVPVFLVVICLSLLFSFFFSGLISEKITSKIDDVGKSLKSLNAGNYAPIKTNSKEPELYSVLNEINELNESTHRYVQKEIEQRNKLNAVLENVSQGIIAVDNDGKIIFANKSATGIFGYKGDAAGEDVLCLIDDKAIYDAVEACAESGGAFEHAYKGRQLSVAVNSADGINPDDRPCSIIVVTDVTTEKEIAKQKSDFFANASHELKTPVAVMQGLSELLLAKDLDDGSKKQVERIHKESVRLASLISDMLKLSKLENGEKSDEVQSEVELGALVGEALCELAPKMEEKEVTASVSGKGTVIGDGKKLYELVENLLSNAVSYNKQNGKIEVTVSEDENCVRLTVADTGIGIEKENIPRLCERFYRVDKSRSKKTGGTGLGLAIVKHICALHDATLDIDSDPGVGTTVNVIFHKQKGQN